MNFPQRKILIVSIALLLIVMICFSTTGCKDEQEPITADVKITLINSSDIPIVNTYVIVQGVTDRDLPDGYTTDGDGAFIIKNLGERNLTFVIHGEEISYRTSYMITTNDLEQREITVKFDDYE